MQSQTMETNKEVLFKGVKIMGGTLFLMILAPLILNSSFKNQDHALFIPVLGVGIIKTLMKAFFND